MLTRRRAYVGDTLSDTLVHILEHEPDWTALPAVVPAAVRTLLKRCLEKEPARRLRDIGDARLEIVEVLTDATGRMPPSAARATSPWGVPAAWPRIVLAAGVLTAAAAAVWAGWSWRASTAVVPASRIDSVVVLPVEGPASHAPDCLRSGLQHGIIGELARVRSVRVIAPSSATHDSTGNAASALDITRRFGVDALVRAEIVPAGDGSQLRIQLVRGRPEQVLWAQTFHLPAEPDLLSVQSATARAIIAVMQVPVTPDEESRLSSHRAVAPQAQEAYLKAALLIDQGRGSKQSWAYLEDAVAASPDWSALHALIARWHFLSTYSGVPPQVAMARAKAAAARALELDPRQPETLTMLGAIRGAYEWDWADAEEFFRQALAVKPGSADARLFYGTHLALMGRHDEAVREARLAVAIDPLSRLARGQLALVLYLAGRFDEAIEEARSAPNYYRLAWALLAADRTAEAVAAIEQGRKLAGESSALWKGFVSEMYSRAGRQAEARALLDELLQLSTSDYLIPSHMATIYAGLGEIDETMRWLQRAYESRDINLPYYLLKLKRRNDPVASDRRFVALAHRVNIPMGAVSQDGEAR